MLFLSYKNFVQNYYKPSIYLVRFFSYYIDIGKFVIENMALVLEINYYILYNLTIRYVNMSMIFIKSI